MKKIMILGADGYLGWPCCMYFAEKGYNVFAVDNYDKRMLISQNNLKQLYKTPKLDERVALYNSSNDNKIHYKIIDVKEKEFRNYFKEVIPDTVIHLAEQPSAPYSMLGYKEAKYTIENNILTTLNIADSILNHNKECHLVKLGTMGEYGTPNIDIEEGFIEVNHKNRKDTFLFPRQANSLYHTSKIMDTDLLWFYTRSYGLKVTDLMQGPVYGLLDLSDQNDILNTCFNYDEYFGTVINRFILQALIDHPLTIYGEGNQTRGIIHIDDSIKCMHLSELNPPKSGEMNIYNQISETMSINQIAKHVSEYFKIKFNKEVSIKFFDNPRIEKNNHYYNPTYSKLNDLGFEPQLLSLESIDHIVKKLLKYKNLIDKKLFDPQFNW